MSNQNQSLAEQKVNRESVIIRTSIIGILANIVLAAFKAVVGLSANSIAIVLDAVNNLSDALSSVITIIGTKLAGRPADKKHPLGYGRIEYISTLIVAAIVLYAGATSLVESVKKIIHPEVADYSSVTLIIVATAIVVKLMLGSYVKSKGRAVNSGSLIASGSDAAFDAILSASVLLSAIIYLMTSISLEAWVGLIISGFIIKAGIEMISGAVDEILGSRIEDELAVAIKKAVSAEEGVHGAYDLLVNNYGPNLSVGSIHVEVDETLTAIEIDHLTRRVQAHIFEEFGVIIATVGVYAVPVHGTEGAKREEEVRVIVMGHEHVIGMHGFYVDFEQKQMSFDMIISFECGDIRGMYDHVMKELQAKWPDWQIHIALDRDLSA